jgi:ABC-type polar amino acid transport system ATPase subunit
VLGRSEAKIGKYGSRATAYVGKVVMSGGQNPVLGRKVLLDIAEPHVVLVCGKRGGGKSFTMAVLIEEFARLF